MADSNYSNAAERNELAQDDPFAELTRIMGHDLRPTVRGRAPQEEEADSLALELENELMGELTDGFDQAAADAPETSGWEGADRAAHGGDEAQPAENDAIEPEAAFDRSFEDVFDDVFAGDDATAEPKAAASAHEEEAEVRFHRFSAFPGAEDPFVIRDEDLAALDADFAVPAAPWAEEPSDDIADAAEAAEDGAAGDAAVVQFDHGGWDEQPEAEGAAHEGGFGEPAADADWDDDPEPAPDALSGEPTDEQAAYDDWTAAPAAWDEGAEPAQETLAGSDEDLPDAGWQAEETGEDDAASHWLQAEPEGATEETAHRPRPHVWQPEVETVDVPDDTVAVADSFDIPVVPYREKVKPAAEMDEIEQMLAGAFGEMDEEPEDKWVEIGPRTTQAGEDTRVEDYLSAGLGFGVAAATATAGDGHAAGRHAAYDEFQNNGWTPDGAAAAALAPSHGVEPPVEAGGRRFGSRTLVALAVLGGAAILGGAGFFALTFGSGEPEGPVLVRADDTPVKVKPENPGGTAIPNQDNQVYKRVSGETAEAEPAQTRLVSTTEEPVDLAPPAPETVPPETPSVGTGAGIADAETAGTEDGEPDAAKIEDRLESIIEEDNGGAGEVAALTPRRVRSFVVRPDGTMVPREVPEPAEAVEEAPVQAAPTPAPVQQAAAQETPAASGSSEDAAQALAAAAAADVAPAQEQPEATMSSQAVEDQVETAAAAAPQTPRSVPIPPSRPSGIATAQPAQPQRQASAPAAATQAPAAPQQQQTQVAAVQPPPAQAAAASEWSVQIASQPSVEGAQQSYQTLAQRHGSLLQGKGVNIVKADIEGKGTYYRVRIPSSSKDDAIRLCEQLKAAGGSCFVSK